MVMDIGQNEPGALQRLAMAWRGFERADRIALSFPQNVLELAKPGSEIDRILEELPEPPVDPRLTISYGITSAMGSIRQILSLVESDSGGTTPIVLQSLARTALLGAARVVYMLGPDDHRDRVSNTTDILTVEGGSLRRAYRTFSSFTQLTALVPPAELVANQEERLKAIGNRGRLGEQEILNRTAGIAAHLIASAGITPTAAERSEHEVTLREGYQWIFNTFSGVAHGFAWPSMVPGTATMSGDFIADFGLTVDLACLAVDLVEQRRKLD